MGKCHDRVWTYLLSSVRWLIIVCILPSQCYSEKRKFLCCSHPENFSYPYQHWEVVDLWKNLLVFMWIKWTKNASCDRYIPGERTHTQFLGNHLNNYGSMSFLNCENRQCECPHGYTPVDSKLDRFFFPRLHWINYRVLKSSIEAHVKISRHWWSSLGWCVIFRLLPDNHNCSRLVPICGLHLGRMYNIFGTRLERQLIWLSAS